MQTGTQLGRDRCGEYLFIATILLAILAIFLTPLATAVPSSVTVSPLTSNEATFTATGGSGYGYFAWAARSGGPYIWSTPNQSVSGSFTDAQTGAPMLTGKTYYVVACDDSGCSNEVAFSVPTATLINQTDFGSSDLVLIMRSGFNITKTLPIMMKPYSNNIGGAWGAALVWGMLFLFIFTSYWMRTGDITIPMMLALLFGASMVWGSQGWGMPPMFVDMGVGLMAASLAGMFFSWFTK